MSKEAPRNSKRGRAAGPKTGGAAGARAGRESNGTAGRALRGRRCLLLSGDALAALEPHPLVTLAAPPMLKADRDALAAVIARDGYVRQPARRFEGKLLDGNNRKSICVELGLPLPVTEYDPAREGPPLDFVIAQQTHRNSTESMRAMAAARALPELRKSKGPKGRVRDHAAAMFGCSPRYVSMAIAVLRREPALADDVRTGKLKLTRAQRAIERRQKAKAWKAAAARVKLDPRACRIIVGKCEHELDQVKDESVALCFTDPPYGIDDNYNGFDDRLTRDQLLKIVAGFTTQLVRVLAPTGTALVVMSSRYARHVGNLLEAAGLHDRGPLVWAEKFGAHNPKRYTDCYRVINWFTKSPTDFTFNWQDTRTYIPSDRAETYGDDRRDGDTKLPPNVWGVWTDGKLARLVDNARERIPDKISPNQLPVGLVERAVLLHSNEKDLVLDAFHGTGTTAVAALLHARRYVGVEVDGEVAERSREWIKSRLAQAGGATK
jgi:adenine-specific DNA-methyltransferase